MNVIPTGRTAPTTDDTGSRADVGGEIVPLAERARALAVLRVVITVAVLGLAAAGGSLHVRDALVVAVPYLVITSLLGLAVYLPRRSLGIRAFGFALLLDGAYLQNLLQKDGHGFAVQFAIAAFLVAVTLLGSFRTGIKIAVWSSILLVIGHQAQVNGLIAAGSGRPTDLALVSDLVLMWIVVVTAATAASINERELRRRRYDAEVLRRLATVQHRSETPGDVLGTLVTFIHHELDAGRVLLCRDAPAGLEVLHGLGLSEVPDDTAQHAAESALLRLVTSADPVLVLRMDPARDAWLAGHLPGASKLVAVHLTTGGEPVYLVLELKVGGTRVERRVVDTLEQAAATTALALSRAELLVQARRSASTDGLTGAWNRRTFDAELTANVQHARQASVPVSLIMVDVDHFKKVNDDHGHQVGDEVLVLVAHTLAATLHALDDVGMAYRYGGEEFSVLLPGADASTAAAVGEHLRAAIANLQGPVPVTASFGVAAFGRAAHDEAGLVLHADAALLQAKQRGRNQVRLFEGATTLAAAQIPTPRRPSGIPTSHPSA
ncbi:GGDEF domain-containing protein [Cellulomonas sp. URHB0016]